MINLNELNSEQKKAAETIFGPVLILAGAGSGKTRTITYRIAHMLVNERINPKEVLAVSFTNKAAQEMYERVKKIVPSKQRRGLSLSTFHSLGIKILREDIHHLGYNNLFTIYDTSDQMSIIREALKHFKAEKSFDKATIQSKISLLKNKGISCEEYPGSEEYDAEDPYDEATHHVYQYYQEKLHFCNALDFDDILFLVVKLFEQFPEVARKYSERYRFIMIDEYQDTNGLQFKLVQGLTKTHQNICVVGDDDQGIYAFRGADISNILNFERIFSDTKVIKLEQNYRSEKPILDLANQVIKLNKKRKEKTMKTTRLGGELPELWMTGDSDHEAMAVIEDIIKKQEEGLHLGDAAILYRSNTQIPPFEDQLRLSQVPYRIIGGQKFYEKKEIKDLIAYLCVILNPFDEISLRRILNTPHRKIGPATLKKYLEIKNEKEISLYQVLKNDAKNDDSKVQDFVAIIEDLKLFFKANTLLAGLQRLVDSINYLEFIEGSYDSPKLVSRKKDDVKNFLLSADRFTDRFKEDATLKNFIERLLLADSQDQQNQEEEKSHQVTLMTLHSSKGLEYDYIYMVGVEEETLPHKRTILLDQDISEELRLCYVGMTRARKKLFMTYAKERKIYGKNIPRNPSRFLNDFGEFYLKKDKTSFEGMAHEEVEAYKKNVFDSLLKSLE